MKRLRRLLIRALPGPIRYPVIRDLPYLLGQARPQATLSEKLLWLEKLMEWISLNPRERTTRVKFVLQLLKKNPAWQSAVAATLRSILNETSGQKLFSDTGLPSEHGFFSEAAERIVTRFLPRLPREHELSELVPRIFPTLESASWLEDLPPEQVNEILALIDLERESGRDPWHAIHESMADALLLLSSNIRSLSLSEDVRERSPEIALRQSPGILLSRRCENFTHLFSRAETTAEALSEAAVSCRAEIEAVRGQVRSVFAHLEEFGLSVSLVYRLEKMSACLDRMDALFFFLTAHPGESRASHGLYFLAHLVRGSNQDRSVLDLLETNLHLLARKVAERTGATGEHYITRTPREYLGVLASAGGGGVLTTFTAVLKYDITWQHLPLFFDAFFVSFNYATSFLALQILGFRLATKTSSVTAAALAGKIPRKNTSDETAEFVNEVAMITRSQFVAAIGNIGFVVPASIAFDLSYRWLFHRSFFDAETAVHVIHSLDPIKSWTVPCAILTGFLLWFSSICSGWLENWSAYRQVPKTIRYHRMLNLALGERRTQKLAAIFARNVAGFGSNISLGILMGVTPSVGKFFGLPLDVRHVTLSSGSLALAVSSLGTQQAAQLGWGSAAVGILIIAILNFGVSFSFSLAVALRARDIDRNSVAHLLGAVARRLLWSPFEFVLPVGKSAEAPTGVKL